MDSSIKVSVIIPIYNVEKYLEECLISALKQTLKNIEIICVNDGTKDNSMKIVEKYSNQDNRIVIINKENGGLSSARNAGIEKAVGEYLYFLDSDDYILEETLETLYNEAKENDLDNIYFDAKAFFDSDEIQQSQAHYIEYYKRKREYNNILDGKQMFIEMEKERDFRPSACLQLPRRSLVLDNNIKFYKGIVHEDNLFSLQCITLASKVKYIAKEFYLRRVREESIMTNIQGFNNSWGYFICELEYLNFIKDKSFSLEFYDTVIKRMIAIQDNAINKVKNNDFEEISVFLADKPMDLQLRYKILILRNAEYRAKKDEEIKMQKEKVTIWKERYDNKQKEIKQKDINIKELKQEIEDIRNSYSFKAGKIIMFIPGKIKRFVLSIKIMGVKYTFNAIKRKIFKK